MWTVSDDALVAGLAARATTTPPRPSCVDSSGGCSVSACTIVADDRRREDIAQEAFVRAWKHAGTYDPRRGSVVGWLLTITRNLAIDAVRVRRPIAFDPLALLGYDQPSPERSPPELAQLRRHRAPAGRDGPRCRGSSAGPSCSRASWGTRRERWARSRTSRCGTAKTRIRTALIRLRAALVSEERTE